VDKGGSGGIKGGGGQKRGEMTQTLYAHMKKKVMRFIFAKTKKEKRLVILKKPKYPKKKRM
jgi:hypothetical protein